MTREEFDLFVNRIEGLAKENPAAIRRKARALVFIGYASLAGMMLLSIGLVLALGALLIASPNAVTIKLALFGGIPAIIFCFSLLSSLRIPMSPPEGTPITRRDAPRIFEMLDELSAAAKASGGNAVKFDKVLITPDFNAAVVQVPRLGVFGWHVQYLILGLPMMETLGPDEFKGVLAHEYAHLSGQHGRFGNWIYRTRATWEQLVAKLSEDTSWGSAMVRGFLGWFWPRFNGHAFALSRGQEYEADAFAAQAVGAEHIGRALQRTEIVGSRHEEAWKAVSDRISVESEPPENVYNFISRFTGSSTDSEKDSRSLAQALRRSTDTSDTHPSLSDRLNSLGIAAPQTITQGAESALPFAEIDPSHSAAAKFLDRSQVDALKKRLSIEWRSAVSDAWQAQHQQLALLNEQLAQLPAIDATLPNEQRLEILEQRMDLLLGLEQSSEAEKSAREILAIDPEHANAHFIVGSTLLEQDNDKGVVHIERAMELNPEISDSCLGMLYNFHRNRGDGAQLEEIKRQADTHDERMNVANAERSQFTVRDTTRPHTLSEKDIDTACATFAKHKEVSKVYAVCKETGDLTHIPMFVFAIETKFSRWKFQSEDAEPKLVQAVAESLELSTRCTFFIFTRKMDKKAFKKCAQMNDSLIYQR